MSRTYLLWAETTSVKVCCTLGTRLDIFWTLSLTFLSCLFKVPHHIYWRKRRTVSETARPFPSDCCDSLFSWARPARSAIMARHVGHRPYCSVLATYKTGTTDHRARCALDTNSTGPFMASLLRRHLEVPLFSLLSVYNGHYSFLSGHTRTCTYALLAPACARRCPL